MKTNLTDEEMLLVIESAWFSFRHNYQELAEYLDLSDNELKPIMEKLDSFLRE
jgi:hypothetical protein